MKRILLAALVAAHITPALAGIQDDLATNGAGSAGANQPMSMDLNAVQNAFNDSSEFADTKHFRYDKDAIYKLRLRQYMDTTIVLPKGEQIKSFSLGEDKNFHFTPLSKDDPTLTNMGKVWPTYPGADTNLTIVGKTGRVYSFYLRSDSVKSTYLPTLTAYVDGPDPEGRVKGPLPPAKQKVKLKKEYLKSLGLVNPENLDYSYEFVDGDMDLAPIRVFSDGHMTYFQFGAHDLNNVHRLPTIYRVVDGHDTPANTRIVGGTVVAETVSDKWTLRNGDDHLCMRHH